MRWVLITFFALVYVIIGQPDYLLHGAPLCRALTYHFFHANVFHLLANMLPIWSLFSPKCRVRPSVGKIITAYLIATATFFVATRPILGLSNILFALSGLSIRDFRRWIKQPSAIVFLGVSVIMLAVPAYSGVTHLLSFSCGVVLSALYRRVWARQ